MAISGRRDEAELQAMVDVTAPILLTRAAPPARSPDPHRAGVVHKDIKAAESGKSLFERSATAATP